MKVLETVWGVFHLYGKKRVIVTQCVIACDSNAPMVADPTGTASRHWAGEAALLWSKRRVAACTSMRHWPPIQLGPLAGGAMQSWSCRRDASLQVTIDNSQWGNQNY